METIFLFSFRSYVQDVYDIDFKRSTYSYKPCYVLICTTRILRSFTVIKKSIRCQKNFLPFLIKMDGMNLQLLNMTSFILGENDTDGGRMPQYDEWKKTI